MMELMGAKMKYRTKTWLITSDSESDSLFVSFFSTFMITGGIICYDMY